MNRKEEIDEAAKQAYFRMSQGVDYHLAPERQAGFIEGAEWADENPLDTRSVAVKQLIGELVEMLNEALRALDYILHVSKQGDGTSTECEMAYTAEDALTLIAEMKKNHG
jgi:hypothetical protein